MLQLFTLALLAATVFDPALAPRTLPEITGARATVAAEGTERMVQVTSWADKGITPDLNPGRWVQLGDATPVNFLKTGLPGPNDGNQWHDKTSPT